MAIGNDDTIEKGAAGPSNSPQMAGRGNYDIVAGQNIYEFLTNSYEGTNGYRTGRYLIPHITEQLEFYERRQAGAFYKNFVKPILRAMIDPVFNAEIVRSVMVNKEEATGLFFNDFIEDATGCGETMQALVDQAATVAYQHGVSFVVMDNMAESEQPQSKVEALEARTFPYAYTRTIVEVDSWKTGKLGELEMIEFRDADTKDAKGNTVKNYSRWDKQTFLKLEARNGADGKEVKVTTATVKHGLGVVPVLTMFTVKRKRVDDIRTDPPLYDIAKINHAIFNKDSEIRDQERAQAFAIFYMQEDSPGNVSVGVHNYLGLPMATNIPPGFASPDPAILKGLIENNELLREDLFRIAGQAGVNFRSKAPKSGDALEWEFQAQEVVLKKTAMLASNLEYRLAGLFKLYTKEEFEYVVKYPDNFGPQNDEAELGNIDKGLMMTMPPKAANMLKKMAFRTLTRREDEQEVADCMDEFDQPMPDSTTTDSATDEIDKGGGDTTEEQAKGGGGQAGEEKKTEDAPVNG